MAVAPPERTRREIVRLAHLGLGVRDFSLAAARTLHRSVPFDGVCVVTMDPATLLPTGHVAQNGLPDWAQQRYAEIEAQEPDYNKFTALARARRPAASLSAATGGKLTRSRRHRELRGPSGFGDELRAVFADGPRTWGGVALLREAGRPDFAAADLRVLSGLSRQLAEGLRRAVLLAEIADGGDAAPGLLLLADDNTVERGDASANAWLADLGADGGEQPPVVVRMVADRTRSVVAGGDAVARARVRTASGRWLLVRGSMLGGQVAIVLEPLRAPELAPLIADALGLTERERLVTQLVARGLSTGAIARTLHLSPYTVQDHLKAIFEKTGVGSRGELVARLYFEHQGRGGLDA